MTVHSDEVNGHQTLVLTPTDELLTAEVVQACEGLTKSSATKHVVIDFKAIRLLVSGNLCPDAEPFNPMLKLHQQFKGEGRRLVLCNLSSEIADVFRITRLDQIFEIQPDIDSALWGVNKRPK